MLSRTVLPIGLLSLAALLAVPAVAGSSEIAELIYSRTAVYDAPNGKVKKRLANNLHSGQRVHLMVLSKQSLDGVEWLRVRLPHRPNDAKGWIKAEQTALTSSDYRVLIDRSSRRLYLYQDDRVVMRSRVVIGARATPTPLGRFALFDRYRPGRSSLLNPWVLELTAHSEKLRRYEGGQGRVALHGMRGALKAPLGAAVSHGCVRLPDRVIKRLARQLPLGAPVTIRR